MVRPREGLAVGPGAAGRRGPVLVGHWGGAVRGPADQPLVCDRRADRVVAAAELSRRPDHLGAAVVGGAAAVVGGAAAVVGGAATVVGGTAVVRLAAEHDGRAKGGVRQTVVVDGLLRSRWRQRQQREGESQLRHPATGRPVS